jgi:hypothetical protein
MVEGIQSSAERDLSSGGLALHTTQISFVLVFMVYSAFGGL